MRDKTLNGRHRAASQVASHVVRGTMSSCRSSTEQARGAFATSGSAWWSTHKRITSPLDAGERIFATLRRTALRTLASRAIIRAQGRLRATAAPTSPSSRSGRPLRSRCVLSGYALGSFAIAVPVGVTARGGAASARSHLAGVCFPLVIRLPNFFFAEAPRARPRADVERGARGRRSR